MRKLLGTLTLCLGFILNLSAQDNTFSLDDAIKYALKENVNIVNAQLAIEDAQQLVYETRSIGLPQVNGSVEFQRFLKLPTSLVPAEFFGGNPGEFAELQFGTNNNLTAGLTASMLAFDGSFLVGLQAARDAISYSQLEMKNVEYGIENNVTEAYLGTLVLKENQAILQKNIDNLTKILNETKALYKEGFVEQLDVDRLELSLMNLTTELENLQRQEELAKNALKYTMGFPIEQELEVKDDIETLLATAFVGTLEEEVNLTNRPEINFIDKGVALNELNIKRYQAGYLPSLVAFASYNQQLQTNKIFEKPNSWFPTFLVGLQLNVPIFDGFDKRSKIERAKIQLETVKNQRTEVANAITLEVANAKIAYANAASQLESQQRNISLAERIYNTTQIKYKEGVGSSLEVTQAEQSLYQSQANYLNAMYNLLVAKANLDKALGK